MEEGLDQLPGVQWLPGPVAEQPPVPPPVWKAPEEQHAAELKAWLQLLMARSPEVKIQSLIEAAAEEALFGLVEPAANSRPEVTARIRHARAGQELLNKRRTFVRAMAALVRELEKVLAPADTADPEVQQSR